LVGLDDVFNDVVNIFNIDSEHLDGFPSVFDWLHDFFINSFFEIVDPSVGAGFDHNS